MASLPLRKDSIRTRRSILAAAEDLLAGDPEASFAEISIAAGVSTATVYRHFNDRAALLTALMERGLEEIRNDLSEWEIGPTSFEDLLRLFASRQARFQGVLTAVRRGEVVGSRIEELETRTREVFVEPLAAAAKAKRVRDDLTIEDVIPLLAMIDGALSAVAAAKDRKHAADRAVDVILAGIARN